MPEAAKVFTGPAEIALTRMLPLAEIDGEIAHRRLRGRPWPRP